MSENLPQIQPHSSSTATAPADHHNQPKEDVQMAALVDDYADGQLKMRLDKVSGLQMERKSCKTGTIARFAWELGALKHNILNEENAPKPHLIVYLQCDERSKRMDGWSCTARIKITMESKGKSKAQHFDHIRFPVQPNPGLQLPWDKLLSDFQLGDDNDWLDISAKISIVEQFGYGSLIQLNTRLGIHGNGSILVNKFHLATYSSYFQAFFFSEWSKDKAEYELNDPNDDVEALQLMLAMAYPVDNYPHPSDAKISEVLRLADKYDLQIVSERCEKYLMAAEGCREQPLLHKLALAERYGLFNLKSHCLERISPAHFCLELRENIALFGELSEGLRAELEERLARKSREELGKDNSQQQQNVAAASMALALPPPHKRVRPRPKTPPRPNYNLPPFRFNVGRC